MYLLFGYFLFVIYIFSLIFFIVGIFKVIKNNNFSPSFNNVSIIVCVRNGESSICNILNDLKSQNYDGNLEFIIIDDNSQDKTKLLIHKFIEVDNRFKYYSTENMKSNLNHKKRALKLGIDKSNYEWLLFTDVDCRVGKNWVKEMSKKYNSSDYVIGLSKVKEGKSLVSKFQSIDFNMLMISACATAHMNYPLACSGQNQSYKKSIYLKVDGFEKIYSLLQGDDSIFLQLCRKIKNIKISFSTNSDSYVIAKTHSKWSDFLLQRVRWAGDANIMWKYNKSFFIIILSTFHSNLFILYLILTKTFYPFVFLLVLKLLFEYLVYHLGNKKLNQEKNNLSFIIWFLIQIPYIVCMGFGSFFVSQIGWRGRRV